MNREIKFRAWVPKGHWINEEGMIFDWQDTIFPECLCFIPDDETGIKIMQYAGLKDINAKEIFEGDIVKAEGFILCEVKFYDGSFHYNDIPVTEAYFNNEQWEIKGNVYENPELTK